MNFDKTSKGTQKLLLGSLAWMLLATFLVFFPNISPWIATPIVLIELIFVIGILLAVNLKIVPRKISDYILYSIGLGLAFVLLGGVFINWAFPYFGISQPLAKLPLMIFFDLSVIILSLRIYLFNKDYTLPKIFGPTNKTNVALGIFPWAFVIISACGAEILNNGGNGDLTLIMLFSIALYVLVLIAYRKSISGWAYVSALYSISLSLLLMYSLRSNHILGWDINLEYQVFQATLQNLRWKMSYYPGLDYNACMSITILPTIFKELTNISSEYVYKLTSQLLFAITPVVVYAIARRYLKEFFAFLAGFLFLSQTWFFEQMPALIRQEIAFIFYSIVLLVLLDPRLNKRSRYILFYVFTISVILSHYSTAYVWLALMLAVIVFSYIAKYLIRTLRNKPLMITPTMFIISFIILFAWQVPLTGTTRNVASFATNTNPSILISKTVTTSHVIPAASPSSNTVATSTVTSTKNNLTDVLKNIIATTFSTNTDQGSEQNILLSEKQAANMLDDQPEYTAYPNSTTAGYVPTVLPDARQVNTTLPKPISSFLTILAWIDKLLFIGVFPLIALIGIYLGIRSKRNSEDIQNLSILNIAGIGFIVLMICIPYLQVYYNFTRLYLQIFLSLNILAIMGGMIITKHSRRYQAAILALMAIFIFCSFNGALDQITGGQARITLDQPPSTIDGPYTYDAEVASVEWLNINRIQDAPVQGDSIASLRLQSFGNMSISDLPIFPQSLAVESYVYLVKENVEGKAFHEYGSGLLTYNYPIAFLDANKSLIYNDGDSRIYK